MDYTAAVTLMVLAGLYLILYTRNLDVSLGRIANRRQGLETLASMKDLLHELQQHRGMSGVWLGGNAEFRPKLDVKQCEIEQAIRSVDTGLKATTGAPRYWLVITEGWTDLQGRLGGLTTTESFERHTRIILRLLDVMEEFGDDMGLTTVTVHGEKQLAEALVSKLPGLTEMLGQSRALGASALAQGAVTTVTGMRLNFLAGQITNSMGQLVGALGGMPGVAGLSALDTTERYVASFVDTLEAEFVDKSRPQTSAEKYFTTATRTIDTVYELYNRLRPILLSALQQRAVLLQSRRRWAMAGSILFVLAVAGYGLARA